MPNWESRGRDSTRHAFEPIPLDLPLQEEWQTKVSGAILAPAVGSGDAVYICSLAALYRIDAGSGAISWEYPYRELPKPRINGFKSSPAIVDDRVIVTDTAGTVYWVDNKTGRSLRVVDHLSARSDSVGIYDQRVYLNGRREAGEQKIYGYTCLDIDGEEIWFRELSGPNRTSSAAIKDGIVVCGDMNGFVYGLNAKDGEVLWSTDIKMLVDKPERRGEISTLGVPVIAGSLVVLRIGDRRNLCALDLNDGRVKWTHVSNKGLGYVASADCLAADDHQVFYAMRNQFRSLDLESGEVLRTVDNSQHELGDSMALAGIVVGHHYIAGFNMSHTLAAFNVETGEVEWVFTGEGGFTDEATYFQRGIVIGDDLGYVRRFSKADKGRSAKPISRRQ